MLVAFVSTGFTFGILAILFLCPYMLCKGILLMNEEDFSGAVKFKAMLPLFNIYYAERQYGRSFPVVGLFTSLTFMLFVINTVLMFTMQDNIPVRFICLMAFMFVLIVAYIFSCIFTLSIISATDELYGLKKLIYVTFFPLGYYYIGSYLYKLVLLDAAKMSAVEVE